MMTKAFVKHLSTNCIFIGDKLFERPINLALQEAKNIFTDEDCVLIFSYLQLKSICKNSITIELHCKNDYSKQLYKELRKAIKKGD